MCVNVGNGDAGHPPAIGIVHDGFLEYWTVLLMLLSLWRRFVSVMRDHYCTMIQYLSTVPGTA
jgi:hypothetical protein